MKQKVIKRVKKVWGFEEWLENDKERDYCKKILTLDPGFICSYHYHQKKDETFHILEGKVYLRIEEKNMILRPGQSHRVRPGQEHCFASLNLDGEPSKMKEVSTYHEESDSYRLNESRKIDLAKLIKKLQADGLEV